MTLHIPPEPWMDKADCVGHDPDLWFPEEHAAAVARQAKAICAECPVQTECLQHAQQHNIRWGIWGGLTHNERRKITARRRIPGQCINGHVYTDRTSFINRLGHRECRVCKRGYRIT